MNRILRLIPILIFLCIVISINLFHTETSPADSRNCAACQFLNSALATLAVTAALLSIIFIIISLAVIETVRAYEALVFFNSNRSPPSF